MNVTQTTTVAVPRLWTTFAVAWLLVLVITIGMLLREPIDRLRLVATVLGLGMLAGVYLWLTLRVAPRQESLGGAAGPSNASLRLKFGALATMALLVAWLVALVPAAGMWWHVMYAVVGAGLALPAGSAAVTMILLIALSMTAAWLVGGQVELRLLILLAIGAAAVAVRHLTIAVEQLRAARQELARRAVDEERLRIARDLHDLLGHSLSVVILKSELAGRLLPSSPDSAAIEVRDVERAAREALRQVRAAVTGYRQPTLSGELSAARELLTASGIRVSIDDAAGPLPPATDGLLAWAVREGVTNVIRHSRARECAISTTRNGHLAKVTIVDDGCGADRDRLITGSGLAGLAERAAASSGSLSVGPRHDGRFELAVEVPVD